MEAMDSLKNNDKSNCLSIIKAGINIKNDFWEDFIRITNDADGLSKLLDVPKEKIVNWGVRISEALEEVKKENDHESLNKKAKPI